MNLHRTFFICALLFVVLVGCGLIKLAWGKRSRPGTKSFLAIIVSGTQWALADAFNLLNPNYFWIVCAYLGIGALPVAWLAFCLDYSGRGKWLSRSKIGALCLIPAITVPVVATNEWHHWMWENVLHVGGYSVVYGLWHAISASYGYLLFLAGFVLLIQNLIEGSRLHRRQGMVLLAAGLVPWIANLLQIVDVYPRTAPNPTPLAFILSSLAFFWGLFRMELLEIMPLAQRVVIQKMADALVLLDGHDRIIQLNPAAENLLQLKEVRIDGKELAQVLPEWPELVDGVLSHDDASLEIARAMEGSPRFYEVRSTVIRDDKNRKLGRFFFMRDVTEKKQAADERENIIGDLQDALGKVKTLTGLLPICSGCKMIRDKDERWHNLANYLTEHTDAKLTHGLCPDCMSKYFPGSES
jgi:PAS domain S-box-containing protein